MMVVETEDMNSSSSPRLCIFSSLAIIEVPAHMQHVREGEGVGGVGYMEKYMLWLSCIKMYNDMYIGRETGWLAG